MRTKIPKKIEAKLLVESRNVCNLCWKKKDIQIHHIKPVENGGDNSEDNLILLCLNCHSTVHTKKNIARNLNEETLRLYKETWTELVRKYTYSNDIVKEQSNISTIEGIIIHGDRRALYFPIHCETPHGMFRSITDFRIHIQKSGYRLIKNNSAVEAIRQIYKSLIEIEYLFQTDRNDFHSCLIDLLGKDGANLLELKRQTIIYHLNKLSNLIGHNDIFHKDEFEKFGFDFNKKNTPHNT